MAGRRASWAQCGLSRVVARLAQSVLFRACDGRGGWRAFGDGVVGTNLMGSFEIRQFEVARRFKLIDYTPISDTKAIALVQSVLS